MNRPAGILVLAVALIPGAAADQVRLNNPGLAASEAFEYTETIGSAAHPLVASLKLVQKPAGPRLEYRSTGPALESVYWIAPDTLISMASRTLTRADDATVTRSASYESLRPQPKDDEVVVTDLGSLPIVLRGFPWGKVASARLLFVGNPSSEGVRFEVRTVGRETLVAVGRSWDCWHATTGVVGALSLVVPKTDWWFAVEGTHPLVKMSGPSAGPGSPLRTLVLQSFASSPDISASSNRRPSSP